MNLVAVVEARRNIRTEPTAENFLTLGKLYYDGGLTDDARAEFLRAADASIRDGELEVACGILKYITELQ